MANHISMHMKCIFPVHTKAISIKQFATIHHLHERTVFYWIRGGKIKAFKSGGKWWVYPRVLKPKKATRGFY